MDDEIALASLIEQCDIITYEREDVPPAALAMTRSMTSALGRASAGMQLGWADEYGLNQPGAFGFERAQKRELIYRADHGGAHRLCP